MYPECHMQALFAEFHYAECHYAECHYAECHYAECHYAECRGGLSQVLFAGKASNRIELQTVLNLCKLQSCSKISNWLHDTQHNATQYKDNQHNDTQHKVHI